MASGASAATRPGRGPSQVWPVLLCSGPYGQVGTGS